MQAISPESRRPRVLLEPPVRIRMLFSLALAACVAACNVGPNYTAPVVAIDESTANAPDTSWASAENWWAAFNDPQLKMLITAAEDHNLDLALAQTRIREARAQRAAAFGAGVPTANVGGQYDHQRFSQNAAPFNAFDMPNFPWEFNLYQIGFDASWEVDVFGGTRRGVEAANANLQATEKTIVAAIRVSLLGEAGAQLHRAGAAFRSAAMIAEKTSSKAQQQTVALTTDRLNKGVGNELDVSRATAQVAETAAQLPTYERQELQELYRLTVLTNLPLQDLEPLRLVGAGAGAPRPPGIPACRCDHAASRRPDIRRAERLQVAAATALDGVAEADLNPRFSLTGFFDLQSASIEDLFAWRSRAFSIGPTITWPIVEAGRLRAVVAARTAQTDAAVIMYEQTVRNAIAEVRDQSITLSTERERLISLDHCGAVAAHLRSVDLANQTYAQGLTDFLTVLDAQRQLYQAQDEQSQSRTRITESWIALYKSLGGGWEIPSPHFRQPHRPPQNSDPMLFPRRILPCE